MHLILTIVSRVCDNITRSIECYNSQLRVELLERLYCRFKFFFLQRSRSQNVICDSMQRDVGIYLLLLSLYTYRKKCNFFFFFLLLLSFILSSAAFYYNVLYYYYYRNDFNVIIHETGSTNKVNIRPAVIIFRKSLMVNGGSRTDMGRMVF